jgi:hypothetical protein
VSRRPVWLIPLLALCALAIGFAALAWLASGGREFADDAPSLLRMVHRPFALWQSYEETGLGRRWGSFPPLLPPLFGVLVWPWTSLASDFWAIRLGALSWTVALLGALAAIMRRLERTPEGKARTALACFALLPSVWGAAGVIPQEEAYVACFALALFGAGRAGAWGAVPALLVLAALAGKYFLAILLLPLAFASPRPWRNAIVWGGALAAALAAYVGYHALRFGVAPILDYAGVGAQGTLSIWSLLWELGVRPSDRVTARLGVLTAGLAAFAISADARRRRVDLAFSCAATLYVTVLAISRSFPGYVIWALPLALICWTRVRDRATRVALPLAMLAWSGGEFGANLFRGVHLALDVERAAGKSALAERVEALLGAGFPFYGAYVACLALLVASGVTILVLLLRAGIAEARRTEGEE